jgi:hypothetical protein
VSAGSTGRKPMAGQQSHCPYAPKEFSLRATSISRARSHHSHRGRKHRRQTTVAPAKSRKVSVACPRSESQLDSRPIRILAKLATRWPMFSASAPTFASGSVFRDVSVLLPVSVSKSGEASATQPSAAAQQ